MSTWLFALLTALCALLWTPVAQACKCAAPEAPSAALASATAVFEGVVFAIDEAGADLVVSLRVPRAWKGIESAEQIRVRTPKDGAACGFPFAAGGDYLIYAQQAKPAHAGASLEVLRCSRTRPISQADGDIRELGMGSIPVDVHAPQEVLDEKSGDTSVERKRDQPAAGGCASCSLTHGGAPNRTVALWLLGGLVLRIGRRGRHRSRHSAASSRGC